MVIKFNREELLIIFEDCLRCSDCWLRIAAWAWSLLRGYNSLSNNTSLSTMGAYSRRSYSILSSRRELSVESFSSGDSTGCRYFSPLIEISAVPLSSLICRLQSLTRWLPFLSEGQAQRKHSLAAFLLESSLLSMPSILLKYPSLLVVSTLGTLLDFFRYFLDILVGFIRLVDVVPETFKAAISRSRLDSLKYCSVSSSTWLIRRSSARSLGIVEASWESCSCGFAFRSVWSLSIWETNSLSSPKIEANHHTHCATKICWVRLA